MPGSPIFESPIGLVFQPIDLWLVIPTYEERESIEEVVAEARAHVPRSSRILIVDDASPDGTGAVADRLARGTEGGIEVLHRERKAGLGPAYVAGFARALTGGARYVAQMDADGSHDPAALTALIASVERGADLAIGSRYVSGGGVGDWGMTRRALSRGANAYARAILGVGVRDLTSGFRVYRREVLEQIGLETIASAGYAFQVETAYRTLGRGFRVEEVPITFVERRAGRSKMGFAIAWEAAWTVPRMRLRE